MIEQAESFLRDLGFYDVRVRHHELVAVSRLPLAGDSSREKAPPPSNFLHLARIEVGPGELPKFVEPEVSAKVAQALKKIGYAHITLDLLGYRRGGANKPPEAAPATT